MAAPLGNRFQTPAGRGKLPRLIEHCVACCQDDQAGLTDEEFDEVESLQLVLQKHGVSTAHGLDLRLQHEKQARRGRRCTG